jgi:CDP-paratose 2-epimerase
MRTLITGGAGFIGCNLAAALASAGHHVVVVDNLQRPGSLDNLRHLLQASTAAGRIAFQRVDVRDRAACAALIAEDRVDAVVHLAAQVAVTTSITDPAADFDSNARGTLNVLEAVRRHAPDATVLFTSTNKVYGSLESATVERRPTRYVLPQYPEGIPEEFPAVPVTPYGCSKFAADCYVRDYARTYGLNTTVFRASCIYGRWQNGTTDQGWVSWFVRSAILDSELTIYGEGLQVRDLLHVDDLVDALGAALASGVGGAGETFNIGGGPDFSLSVWAEFGPLLSGILARRVRVRYEPCRPGDQQVWVTDIRKLSGALAWKPRRSPAEGIEELVWWWQRRLLTTPRQQQLRTGPAPI